MAPVLLAEFEPHQAVAKHLAVGAPIGIDVFAVQAIRNLRHDYERAAPPRQVETHHWPIHAVQGEEGLVTTTMLLRQQGGEIAKKKNEGLYFQGDSYFACHWWESAYALSYEKVQAVYFG